MTIDMLQKEFVARFGAGGTLHAFFSPGRVNLIGEHTDYNGGFVFPAAITLGTTIIARKREDGRIRMCATDLPDFVDASFDTMDAYKSLPWGNYQMGIAKALIQSGVPVCGCDLLFHDTTPHGGGLSSSAGIEIATALCLYVLSTGKQPDMREMAIIGQKAENEYVGVSCGIMDQFASAMGKKDHAIFLDCKDLSYSLIPLALKDIRIVIANTNKKRSLITSKYNERRTECEKALAALQTVLPDKQYLGQIAPDVFEEYRRVIANPTVSKRAEHVICECDRVLRSAEALQNGDIAAFGTYINASHNSLRDLYEVTGIELDTLVDAARKEEGCLGSRMTGAGFGGCTVSLVKSECVEAFQKHVAEAYTKVIGYAPSFYVTDAGDGGHQLF